MRYLSATLQWHLKLRKMAVRIRRKALSLMRTLVSYYRMDCKQSHRPVFFCAAGSDLSEKPLVDSAYSASPRPLPPPFTAKSDRFTSLSRRTMIVEDATLTKMNCSQKISVRGESRKRRRHSDASEDGKSTVAADDSVFLIVGKTLKFTKNRVTYFFTGEEISGHVIMSYLIYNHCSVKFISFYNLILLRVLLRKCFLISLFIFPFFFVCKQQKIETNIKRYRNFLESVKKNKNNKL